MNQWVNRRESGSNSWYNPASSRGTQSNDVVYWRLFRATCLGNLQYEKWPRISIHLQSNSNYILRFSNVSRVLWAIPPEVGRLFQRSNLPRSWAESGEKKDKNTTQLKWLKARNLIIKFGGSLRFSFTKTNFVHFDQITGLIHSQIGDLFNPKMIASSSNGIN